MTILRITMANSGTFTVIDHTADTGIALEGNSVCDILEAGAKGFISLSFECVLPSAGQGHAVSLEAGSFEELLVELLRYMLLRIEMQSRRINDCHIEACTERSLNATVYESPLSHDRQIITHIKAVTYHDLELKKNGDRYGITVIFDI